MVAGGAQTSGMSEIRGIDIDALAKGFADEETLFKRFCTVTPTSAREIRWYAKKAGFLDSTDTTGMSTTRLGNVAQLALPEVIEPSWTRTSSYVRKYFVESPVISDEDIKDSDPDVLATVIRDLTRAIAYQVDARIWDVLTESQTPSTINSVHCSGSLWASGTLSNPIRDIMDAKRQIRVYSYDPEGGSLLLNARSHQLLLQWLIDAKGSSIPAFASQKVQTGVVMEILGLNVTVSQNVTDKFGLVGNLARACTWKTFTPITARAIDDIGIGTKIRVWEEGEALLTDSRAVCLLSGCGLTA